MVCSEKKKNKKKNDSPNSDYSEIGLSSMVHVAKVQNRNECTVSLVKRFMLKFSYKTLLIKCALFAVKIEKSISIQQVCKFFNLLLYTLYKPLYTRYF